MLSDLRFRVRAFFRRDAMERELAAELQLHFDREVEKLVARGFPPDQARRRARLAMGGVEQVKEETRDAWGLRLVESVVQDARYAFRGLRKAPGFTAAVTLSLALGIGANTAIFTLMDAVLWRMLPVKDPAGLLVVGVRQETTVHTGLTYAQFRLLRDNDIAADLAGYAVGPVSVGIDSAPEPSVRAHLVTGDYFRLLGISAVRGRTLGPDDDRVPNGHPVVMLSDGYWERRFARDQAILGRTIRLSATPFTVVGITPPEFFGVEVGEAPDVFVPIMMQPTVMPAYENLLDNPIVSRPWVRAIARTRTGITAQQAGDALNALYRSGAPALGGAPTTTAGPQPKVVLTPAATISTLRQEFSRPLFVLLAMVGVVLLVACANTANLLLARAAARRPEFAMRLALGAGRGRLIRQMLVESGMLAGLGGVCGILLAHWVARLLVAVMSAGRAPVALDLAPNPRILAFTLVVTIATGLVFGVLPAWRATRVDLVPALKNVRNALGRSLRADRVLSIAQVALSVVLLVGAGLFARSLQNLAGDDPGGVRPSVVMVRVEPRGSDQRGVPGTSERLDRTYRELIRRAEEIPAVSTASMAQVTPTAPSSNSSIPVRLATGEHVRVPQVMVYPNYFATIGIPLVSGREFDAGDLAEGAPAVCIVNESFVRQVLAGEDPIGKPCQTTMRPRLLASPGDRPAEPFAIVGVVRDSPYNNPRGETRPLIYTTFLQTSTGRGQMVLHARVKGNPGEVVQRIREQVAAVDPTVPMFDVHTLQEEMNAALAQHRLVAMLSSVFGALALVLASVGLHGLLAYGVVQRKGELGLRMALGAERRDVAWLVTRDALWLVGIGIVLGVPAALAGAQLMASQVSGLLFGVEATDPTVIAGAVVALVAVAAIAAYLPAKRAAQVDPMLALRAE